MTSKQLPNQPQVNEYLRTKAQINMLKASLANNQKTHPKFRKDVLDAIAALEKILPYF
jgi:hypothetical protein